MGLKKDFYTQIFDKEQEWIKLINLNLLNSIYFKYSLQPFYLEKKRELEQEYSITKNEIIKNIISIIDSILEQINIMYEQFNLGRPVNINSLLPLFLTTQMNSTLKSEENKTERNQIINKLNIRKQLLENQKNLIRTYDKETFDDYVYDDFSEEGIKLR